jgi:germination protein M
LTALFAGPNPQELGADPAMYTWIPSGARYLAFTIDAGVATANVSADFTTGSDADVRGRFAQVVYTLTQFPTVTGVRFLFDGVTPKTVFIGAFTRADYTDLLPPIWVDQPAWGGALSNPARITGLTDVAEAQFQVEILDATGKSLTDQPVHASCGSGCWGTFDVTLSYTVATAQQGTLRVYDQSAQDGSRIHVVDYPVTLTP